MRPVLDTIRALLKFKDRTTISEIASTAGIKRADVLRIINVNGHMVWRDRKTGQITRVDPQSILTDKLRQAGAFFWVQKFDYGSTEGLEFNEHQELREKLLEQTWGGGMGDSYPYSYVPNTEANRVALTADGCVPYDDSMIDDREWKE